MHTIHGRMLEIVTRGKDAWLFKILSTGRQLVNLLRTYLKKKKSTLIADFQGSVEQINLLINIE